MSTKKKLVTGSTDGIGLLTAKKLVALGHTVLLHGRNSEKLAAVGRELGAIPEGGRVESYTADLSRIADVESLASAVTDRHLSLDALINNAGVFRVADPHTPEGIDARFMVNTIAPYLLTRRLLPLLGTRGRVVNLSSAAQAPVDLGALSGPSTLSDSATYAQSKLAIAAWSHGMALELGKAGPVVTAVNPGSLLGTKMVKEAYGMDGADIGIGADLLVRAALSEEFQEASGRYFDNDSGRFATPHPDAEDAQKIEGIVRAIEKVLSGTSTTSG